MQCIVCGSKILHPVFNPGPQPLAALNLPRSWADSESALRYPMNFMACAFCGHVFNVDFNYAQIPYAEDSNLMYNSGVLWVNHMQQMVDKIADYQFWLNGGKFIDIGCGDGQFFDLLLKNNPSARCIGYEPGIEADRITNFEVVRDYFIPERDLKKHRPTLLVCRHVVEHLDNPRDFISEIAYWCNIYDLETTLMVEVPCFNTSMKLGRFSDFLYEHVSNFTVSSFKTLFAISGFDELEVSRYYGDEVLVGFFCPNSSTKVRWNKVEADMFCLNAQHSIKTVQEQLKELSQKGPIVFWGGTGKSAAFLNMYEIYSHCYPNVVDSDSNKLGRFVPGTGQEICAPEKFRDVDNLTIVITTPWRAADIALDIHRRGIRYERLRVLDKGVLSVYND